MMIFDERMEDIMAMRKESQRKVTSRRGGG